MTARGMMAVLTSLPPEHGSYVLLLAPRRCALPSG